VGDVPLLTKIAAGLTTGALAICIASPTDLVKVRMQTEGKLPAGTPKKYPSALGAYTTIAKCATSHAIGERHCTLQITAAGLSHSCLVRMQSVRLAYLGTYVTISYRMIVVTTVYIPAGLCLWCFVPSVTLHCDAVF
jgi:hypothetical protein